MEYIVDIKFEDNGYNAIVHFVSTFVVNSPELSKLFVEELSAGLKRNKVAILSLSCLRLDDNVELRERQYEYYEFCKGTATATINIQQFMLESPDQTRSFADNLTEKFFNGEESTAFIGKTYSIPVRVRDKKTKNPIPKEFYYLNIEHLIPKN